MFSMTFAGLWQDSSFEWLSAEHSDVPVSVHLVEITVAGKKVINFSTLCAWYLQIKILKYS